MFHMSWWTQKAMGYHRLWVITVWVISGLTVDRKSFNFFKTFMVNIVTVYLVIRGIYAKAEGYMLVNR